jgi:hypothetical protein
MAESDHPTPDQPSQDPAGLLDRLGVDRRTVLKAVGGSAATAAFAPLLDFPPDAARMHPASADLSRALVPYGKASQVHFQAMRVLDMLYLDFDFYNARKVVRGGQTFVVPVSDGLPAYMVVIFQSQHLGEESVRFPVSNWPYPPLHGALSGPSWLAFELPKHAEIPLTAEGLLNWTGLKQQIAPIVQNPVGGLFPKPPDALHTALEVPWSLWLSPHVGSTWHHVTGPVTSGRRTELWHTRLGMGGLEPPKVTLPITAFWAYGFSLGAGPPPDPFFMSLNGQDRVDLLNNTLYIEPATGSFLALSALGASINVQGSWPATANSLISWIHRASVGRDSYVRVVNLGYLFPFGNQAVKIKITDREFQVDNSANVHAYLVTREYIVVTQPEIVYAGDPNEPDKGRGNPIRQVKAKTVATPPIDFDGTADPGILVGPYDPNVALWVRSDDIDVPFAFTVTDIEGRSVDITTSVIWLDKTLTDNSDINLITALYDAEGPFRNSPSFGGALFAFADTQGALVGSTAHHVDNYTLTATFVSNGLSNFYPQLNHAAVRLPGAEQLVGVGGTPLPAPSVSIHPSYLTNGFLSGVAEIYLQVTQNGPGLNFPVNLVGGMAAPNIDVTGLARDIGTVAGDLDTLLAGKFDPTSYFSSLTGDIGKLFGAISIIEIIAGVDPNGAAANAQAPQITNNFVYPNNDKSKPPTAIDTKLKWQPKVTTSLDGFFVPHNSKLLITAEIYTPISQPSQTTYSIHGELNNFDIVLFGNIAPYLGISFTSLTFDSKTGAKTSLQPTIKSVSFMGPLTFIQDLEQLLASIGGPSIDVTSAGINASYSLALPDVGVGVFSLSNLSINAGLNIPFDGSPVRVRFGLCTQDNPFLLTVWIFGGGGYFSLALGADGIEGLQVELDFGAAVSIDLGVASGGVSIMAGIYYSVQQVQVKGKTENQVQLTGFLRADGHLSVLGIITLSMEFYLALTYLDPGQAYGEATVTVSISILFFSASVSATMRKTLGGGQGQSASIPTPNAPNALASGRSIDFKAAISRAAWDTYCEAFAS